MSTFSDTKENALIFSEIRPGQTTQEVQRIIEKYFPGWLVYSFEDYSKDYPHLKKNWKTICDMTQSTPKRIVLVADINFDAEHTHTARLCEFMTRSGYCVRRVGELIPCTSCYKAIPAEHLWRAFIDKGDLPVPGVWKDKCSDCN